MCGRFYLDVDFDDILERYGYLIFDGEFQARSEIFPTTEVAVISPHEHQLKLSYMNWGFTASFSKRPIINARSESVFDKKMFKQSILNHRCIVPASGYFEWLEDSNTTIKHRVTLANHGIFSMAGIYRLLKDSDGNIRSQVSILTQEANSDIAWLHDRVPFILDPKDEANYLDVNLDQKEIEKILCINCNDKFIIEAVEEMQMSLFE